MSRRIGAAIAATAALLAGTGAAGCSVVNAVRHVTSTVTANRAAIDAFASSLKPGTATPFEVTYETTDGSRATIVYAVRPPRDIAFAETSGGSGGAGTVTLRLIANSSGEYSCASLPAGSASPGWACQKLGASNAAAQNQIIGLYTPAHWVAFLSGLSIAAGFAGDKVTSSTMTVNGITLHCVNFRTHSASGTSTICSTAQGLLGYVRVAGNPVGFEIKSFTASPSAALFRLPAGTKVTRQTPNGG